MIKLSILSAALLIASAPLRAEVIDVDVAALEQLRERGVSVIDLRTPEEWSDTGVIAGSHLVPFADAGGRYDLDGWASRLASIAAPGEPVALVCGIGRRSSIAGRILDRQFGYQKVFNVLGGMKQWIAEGRLTARP